MVSGFELAGLVGTLDATVNLTTRVVTILRDVRHFSENQASIADSFQRLGFALEYFLRALKNLSEDSNGNKKARDDLRNLISDQSPRLLALQSRLQRQVAEMEKWAAGGSLAYRGAWAVWRKREAEGLQHELSEWVNHFHLAYISIHAAEESSTSTSPSSTVVIGRVLNLFRNEEFQSATPLDTSRLPWPRKDIDILQEKGSFALAKVQGLKDAIVELVPYEVGLGEKGIEAVKSQLANTAQYLAQADPQQTKILKCMGYFHDPQLCRLGLLFEIPVGYQLKTNKNGESTIQTLHDTWSKDPPTHSLDQRARLARDIATAILYVHAIGWVHKDVCPQKIILLEERGVSAEEKADSGYLGRAFLLGLHSARNDTANSYLISDEDWKASIYRHPTRQTAENNAHFRMSFDIYSTGVIMLELALWGLPHFRRFVDLPEVFEKVSPAARGEALMELVKGRTRHTRQFGRGIHCEFGKKYRDMVVYCLRRGVLDEGGSLEFVEKVWTTLSELVNAL